MQSMVDAVIAESGGRISLKLQQRTGDSRTWPHAVMVCADLVLHNASSNIWSQYCCISQTVLMRCTPASSAYCRTTLCPPTCAVLRSSSTFRQAAYLSDLPQEGGSLVGTVVPAVDCLMYVHVAGRNFAVLGKRHRNQQAFGYAVRLHENFASQFIPVIVCC